MKLYETYLLCSFVLYKIYKSLFEVRNAADNETVPAAIGLAKDQILVEHGISKNRKLKTKTSLYKFVQVCKVSISSITHYYTSNMLKFL